MAVLGGVSCVCSSPLTYDVINPPLSDGAYILVDGTQIVNKNNFGH